MKTLAILISVCACATALPETLAHVDGRIIDGQNAKRHQFPYIVSVQIEEEHWCGASILSRSWLVSAAHCFADKPSKFVAVAGLLTQGESHQDIQTSPIEEIILHPDYKESLNYNDIALLKLRFRLTFTGAVQHVILPHPNARPEGGAVVSGWGLTSLAPQDIATVLQYLEMDLITNEDCNEMLATAPLSDTSYPFLVWNSMICTKPINTDESACHADSGGPLVQNNVLVGIVHGGDTACGTTLDNNATYPNIFTRVSSFIDFIKDHVEDLPETEPPPIESRNNLDHHSNK